MRKFRFWRTCVQPTFRERNRKGEKKGHVTSLILVTDLYFSTSWFISLNLFSWAPMYYVLYSSTKVKRHWILCSNLYETVNLHPYWISKQITASDGSYEILCAHMKHTTIHRQNRFSVFSTCQCNWIFTPSESHDGLGRARNMNVCALGSGNMWCKHILIKLLAVPHFVRPHILFSVYSCRHLAQWGSHEKQFKEHQLFWIGYTMSCTTWIVALLPCICWY